MSDYVRCPKCFSSSDDCTFACIPWNCDKDLICDVCGGPRLPYDCQLSKFYPIIQ